MSCWHSDHNVSCQNSSLFSMGAKSALLMLLQEWTVSPFHTCRGVVQGHAGSQQQSSSILEEQAHHECHRAGGGSQAPTLLADAARRFCLRVPAYYVIPTVWCRSEGLQKSCECFHANRSVEDCCNLLLVQRCDVQVPQFNAECALFAPPLLELNSVLGCKSWAWLERGRGIPYLNVALCSASL